VHDFSVDGVVELPAFRQSARYINTYAMRRFKLKDSF
jgi:hypothetical protein